MVQYCNTGWLDYEVNECDWFGQQWVCCEQDSFAEDIDNCDQDGLYKWFLMDSNNLSGEIPLDIKYLEGLEKFSIMFDHIEWFPLEDLINLEIFS